MISDSLKTSKQKKSLLSAALYCRISREDDIKHDISVSIDTQRHKLIDFANRSNIGIFNTYCDDGFSGTNYNRPAFGEMLSDIKSGRVNCVIVKDLSRLGREYIQSGQLLENFFPQYETRFIAIDDSIDLDPNNYSQTSSMMIPFFNLMNEFYPSDISKKTRSALQTKGMRGEFLAAYAPLGYKKSPADKNKLIVDSETAKWVKFIFDKAVGGWSLSKIAKELHKLKVPTATDRRKGKETFDWGCSAVKVILDNQAYLGKTIFGKTRRLSYKNKKIIKVPQEQWNISENAHEALISEELFAEAHRMIKTRSRENNSGTVQKFTGKLRCPECDNMLNFCVERRKDNPNEGYFVCRSNKRFGNQECSRHYIRLSILEKTVSDEIRILLALAIGDRFALYKLILSEREVSQQKLKQIINDKLISTNVRLTELEQIFVKLYQDKALKKISDFDYELVLQTINDERAELNAQTAKDKQTLSVLSSQTQDIDAFIDELVKLSADFILDRNMINSLIDFIEVENVSKEFGQKVQFIRIHYKYIGFLKKTEVKD